MSRRLVSVIARLTSEADPRLSTDKGRNLITQAGELVAENRREKCSRAAECTLRFCMDDIEASLTCVARDANGDVDNRLSIEGCALDSTLPLEIKTEFEQTAAQIVKG